MTQKQNTDTAHDALDPLLSYHDLRAAGYVRSRTALQRAMADRDTPFPPGFLVSPNARRWRLSTVKTWLQRREEATAGKKVLVHPVEKRKKKLRQAAQEAAA
jgi:predicted DNA-binding transcriptional regulator AlpA